MNISPLTEAQTKLIKDLAIELAPLVKDIEGSMATTQNHYGRYGAVLSKFSNGNKGVANIIALALIEAGANRTGVANGLKLFC